MTEHRVSVLSTTLRRYEDPAESRDPRIRALVTQLQAVQAAVPAPRAHFRAELRTQLVAVAPRLIAESIADDELMVDIVPRPAAKARANAAAAAGDQREPVHGLLAGLRRIPIARPLGVFASVVTVFALLLGGAVMLSRKALPGDALYGLKRASENVQVALASSDQARAQDYLDFAGTRVDEARALVTSTSAMAAGTGPLADGRLNAHTATLITSTLASADTDVKSASKLLGRQAVKSGSSRPLTTMTTWAPKQIARLKQLAAVMPAGPLRARTTMSTTLVDMALTRAKVLQTKVACSCMDAAPTDSLGPKPCSVCTTPAKGHHPGQPTIGTAPTSSGKAPSTQVGGGTPASPAQGGPGANAKTSGASPDPQQPLPGLNVPSLPIKLPTSTKSLPVSVGSCGLTISLPPIIGLHLGSCSAHP